jgi:hypothetical protein
MSLDPVSSNPDHDEVVFENDRVRVLEYTDQPGERTTQHRHPDSVMYTVSSFLRRLVSGGMQCEVAREAGAVGWVPAQEHSGENIGNTPTRDLRGAEGIISRLICDGTRATREVTGSGAMERATRIELALPVWKTGALPLSYARAARRSGARRVSGR